MLHLMYSVKESEQFIHLLHEIDPSCVVSVKKGNDALYKKGITEDIPCTLEIQMDLEKLNSSMNLLNEPKYERLKVLKYI